MRKYLLHFFLFLFFILSLFSSGIIDSQDGFQYLAVARNIYYTGKPTAPVYEYTTRQNIHMSTYVGRDGNTYSLTGLGFSLALVPAVALTDVIYKLYQVAPPQHFPLESDWVILLLASFTNSFFGALLGVTLFLYFLELGLSKKQAFLISLVSLFSTNLLVYTKHILAHMMFISFLTLSFYFLKKYSKSSKNIFLLFSGFSFGLMMITYNNTFLLTIPVFILYYFMLLKPHYSKLLSKKFVNNLLFFFIGILPLLATYLWFEQLRAPADAVLSSPTFLMQFAQNRLLAVPFTVFFEGIYGQLLSPGRSIFIYSPILLVILIFWHKINSKFKPELFAFISMFIIYVSFYSSIYTQGSPSQGIAGLWHGESSWGPRYLSPVIPFGLLIVGVIFTKLSKKAKYLIFLPLVIIGFYIELLGVILPYQIRLHNLDRNFYVNNTEYTSFAYINLLPRHSPLISMTKNLEYLIRNFPKTYEQNEYNVQFYDGIDFPFNVGLERWRVIEDKGYISFDNPSNNPVKKISLGLINHPIEGASHSAQLRFYLNGSPLLEKPSQIKLTQRVNIDLPIDQKILKDKKNEFLVEVTYPGRPPFIDNPQILGLLNFSINDRAMNIEKIDVPYVSSLGPKMSNSTYLNYGGINKNPWRFWEIHTQMYERFPDFWWLRNLFYWDVPRYFILLLFSLNILGAILFGFRLSKTKSK